MSRALRIARATPIATVLSLAALLGADPAAACSVCYGTTPPDSPLITSAKMGVFLLLGITGLLLGGFARFFFYLRHRARQAESEGIAAEWAQLQRRASS